MSEPAYELARLRTLRPDPVGDLDSLGQVPGRALLQARRRRGAADLYRADGSRTDAAHRMVRARSFPARLAQHRTDGAVGHALHGRHHVLSPRAAGPRGLDGCAVLPELVVVR